MVCVGILSSRNKFPCSKPYLAFCRYLSDCSDSAVLVTYNEPVVLCLVPEVINESISQS